MTKLRLLLADDHRVLREGLKHLLKQNPTLDVVDDFDDARDLCRSAKEIKPDVVILDFSMPNTKAVDTIRFLNKECPNTRVLMLTMYDDLAYLNLCLEAGAAGYILKASPTTDVIQAINTVAEGGVYIDPAMARKVANRLVKRHDSLGEAMSSIALSERESEVLRLVARGSTNKEVADLTRISEKTVETYRSRAMDKLGLSKRSDLLRYALSMGWLDNL